MRRGFTLVELVVVMLVLSLIAFAAVPAFLDAPDESDDARAVIRLTALFRLARDSAARGGAPVTVVIDSTTNRVWLDVATGADEEDSADLELPWGAKLQLSAARAYFTFLPTGAVFGDSLLLVAGGAERLITVHPWTGDVIVY